MYLFAGGDRRSYWAVRFLRDRGLPLQTYGVPGLEDGSIPEKLSILMLPFPIPPSMEALHRLSPAIKEGTLVFGGKFGPHRDLLEKAGAKVIDLYNTEPLTTLNAAATAEGAIRLLIGSAEITLSGSRCLVIGTGRIGMLLGEKLHALGAEVTLSARSEKDRAMICARNLRAEETGVYAKGLETYDFVINTVPAAVLSRAQLARLRKDCVLLELASSPGGFSREDCKDLGLNPLHGPGLPGQFFPKTAGILYGESLLHAMKKEGIL